MKGELHFMLRHLFPFAPCITIWDKWCAEMYEVEIGRIKFIVGYEFMRLPKDRMRLILYDLVAPNLAFA